jgi:flagellar hook-basal body complex protein FliE
MSEFQIAGVGSARAALPTAGPGTGAKGTGLAESFRQALDQVNHLQQAADQASRDFALGQTRDIAGTLIALEKATLGFQFALQIRNKLLEAYQEVMRMPM